MARLLWPHEPARREMGVEGMGGRRPRAARGRADPRRAQGRPPRGRSPLQCPVHAAVALPDGGAPEGGAPEGAVPALDRPRGRGARRRADHASRAGPTSSRRERHRNRGARRDRVEVHLDVRLRGVPAGLEGEGPLVGARAPRAPARRTGHGAVGRRVRRLHVVGRRGRPPRRPGVAGMRARALRRRVRGASKGSVEALPTLVARTT